MEFLAVGNDAWHLRRGASIGGLGVARSGGRRSLDVDADVVVEPEVGALCWNKVRTGCFWVFSVHQVQGRGYIPALISEFHCLNWLSLMPYFDSITSHWSPEAIMWNPSQFASRPGICGEGPPEVGSGSPGEVVDAPATWTQT